MRELLAPLQRLNKLIEAQNEKVNEIHSVLTIDLKEAAKTNTEELSKQTTLLSDIKDLLKQQVQKSEEASASKAPKIKMPGLISGIGAGLAIISMAASLVAASGIMGMMQPVSSTQLLTAIALGGVFTILAPVFVEISESLRGGGIYERLIGKVTRTSSEFDGFKSIMKNTGVVALAMIAMSTAVAVSSFIFQLVQPVSATKLLTALAVGYVLIPLAFAFRKIIIGLARARVSLDAKGLKRLGMVTLSMAAIALGIASVAHIWNYAMPDEFVKLPELGWIIRAGLLITLFTVPFAMLAKTLQKVSFKGILFATLALPLIAVSILGSAWIFQLLPDEFKTPDLKWALGAGLAITIFAIPFALVGILAQAITPVGLLLGAAGMILIAATMFVVAWIFSALPDLSSISANFTNAIMYPINSMIDALGRIKNEIGIQNLLPLAGGLFAVAGGWLALTAAIAGEAVGGVFASAGKAVSGLIDKLAFWADAPETPLTLIDKLASRKNDIIALASPFKTLGTVFANISSTTENVITGLGALIPFTEKGKVARFEKSAIAMDKIANAYQKISKASQSMNIDAINASSKMFEAIARIAENDGEDAMTVLAEQLMEAVEKLSDTVKDLEDATSGQGDDIKDAVSGAIENFTKKILGDKEGSDSQDGMLDMSVVVAAIQELEARFDRPIQVEDSAVF